VTTKYQFTNKSIRLGQNLITDLTKYLKAKEHEYKDRLDSYNVEHSLLTLEVTIDYLKEYQHDSENKDINNILSRDYLTFTEALLILHGLHPSDCFDIKQTQKLDTWGNVENISNFSLLLDYFVDNSEVYTTLSAAITAGKESKNYGIQSDSKDGVYTEQFISWTIDKGFIESTDSKSNTGNISAYYNQERASIAEHNKKVTLEEFENWTPALGSPKSPNAFVNDSTAFSKLKLQLRLLLKEDDVGNRIMPTKDTIAQYIRDTRNSEKS
jgi:hypothetical protein